MWRRRRNDGDSPNVERERLGTVREWYRTFSWTVSAAVKVDAQSNYGDACSAVLRNPEGEAGHEEEEGHEREADEEQSATTL